MKVLIWMACIFCASLVQVLLTYAGIVGALPTMAVYGGMLVSARSLCKKYEENRSNKTTTNITNEEGTLPNHAAEQEEKIFTEKTVVPPILYCRKCGKKLVDDSLFCSYCGTAIVTE